MWKKFLAVVLAVFAAAALTACGSAASSSSSSSAAGGSAAAPAGDTLVVYFTNTGHTGEVARKLASATGADLYQIIPEEPYTSEDLDYRNSDSRVMREHRDRSIRPAISGDVDNWNHYKTVFIGYPIWGGEAPDIMYTFVEHHNFDGKIVIPFATSGGSPVGSSGENLAKAAGTGTWKQGEVLSPGDSVQDLTQWVQKETK